MASSLYAVGVAGTSVSGILEDSGLARRTLYLNFPAGKPELIAAATENASGITISAVETMVSDSDPAQVVQTFADRWADSLEANGFSAGCPIVAAALGRQEAPEAADGASPPGPQPTGSSWRCCASSGSSCLSCQVWSVARCSAPARMVWIRPSIRTGTKSM